MVRLSALAVAAGLVLAGGGLAEAVDLPPAPTLPASASSSEPFSGWFLRGDVELGVAAAEPNLVSVPGPVAAGASSGLLSPAAREAFGQASQSAFGMVDAGAGYRFNAWFRMDGTLEYRSGDRLKAHSTLTDPASPTFGSLQYSDSTRADLSSFVALVNGYADFGAYWGVTPFAGAGAGLADNRVSGFTADGLGSSSSRGALASSGAFANGSKTNFAWALMAGLDIDLAPGLTLEIGYRYLNMGSITTGRSHCLAWGSGGALSAAGCNGGGAHSLSSRGALASNDLRIGLVWMLSPPVAGR